MKVNCAALPAELLESELFGFERGAFTGAIQHKPGKFELANDGTMFLDEIGEMSSPLQAKLLQVLQDGEFSRLGGDSRGARRRPRRRRHQPRPRARRWPAGAFREDLYFRLNVVAIDAAAAARAARGHPAARRALPGPARRRVRRPRARGAVGALAADAGAVAGYDWPGNVRELENIVKRVVVLGDEQAAHEVIERRQITVPARPQPECARRRSRLKVPAA